MSIFYRAAKIAEEVHAGQHEKTGRPYIEHCRRVADAVETIDQKAVAYLHDVLEKVMAGAGPGSSRQVLVQRLLLQSTPCRAGMARITLYSCGARHPLAFPVKRADLQDNIWQSQQIGASASK